MARPQASEAALVFVSALVIALAGLWPFPRVFQDHLAPNLYDPLLNLSLIAWGAHQLPLGIRQFWDAPFLFPADRAMALSEHEIGPALAAITLEKVGLSLNASLNLQLLLSFPFATLGAHWLFRSCGVRAAPAFLGALAFAFAPFRWMHLEHLPVVWTPVLAFVLWCWWRLLHQPSWRRGAAFFAFYAVHLLHGAYYAYMVHIPLAVLAIAAWRRLKIHASHLRRVAVLGTTGLACAIFSVAVYWPYATLAARGYRRGGEVVQMWGATLLSFFTPSLQNRYFPDALHRLYRNENALFVGWLAAGCLIALAVRRWRRQPWIRPSAAETVMLVLGLGLVILALYWGDLVTWTDREAVTIGPYALRIRGYTRPLLVLVCGAVLVAGATRPQRAPSRGRAPVGRLRQAVLAQAAVAAVLSLPIVFSQASRVIPGMSGMGVSSRFFVFAQLGAGLAVAIGTSLLARRLPRRWRTGVLLVGGLLLLVPELVPRPVPWHRLPQPEEFPAVYHEMANRHLRGAVVELPIPPPSGVRSELHRMWYAQLNWNPIANGWSGYTPPTYAALRDRYLAGELESTLRLAEGYGVRFAIVHLDELPLASRQRAEIDWLALGSKDARHLVWRDAETLLVELAPRPAGA